MPELILFTKYECVYKWVNVFKNGPSKICGRQPLRDLKWYGLLRHHDNDDDDQAFENIFLENLKPFQYKVHVATTINGRN